MQLTSALNRRKRIRIVTVLAGLLLLVIVGSILIAKNPKKSKAAEGPCDGVSANCMYNDATNTYTIYTDSSLTNNPFTHELFWKEPTRPQYKLNANANVILDGMPNGITVTTYNFDSNPIVLHDLTLKNGAILTQSPIGQSDTLQSVNLNITGTLTMQTGSAINVSEKGYDGATNELVNGGKGYGPGGGSSCTGTFCAAGGAGHGGSGGTGVASGGTVGAGGTVYDNPPPGVPNLPGSGGGAAKYFGATIAIGGKGGGVINLQANDLYMDASSHISANGGKSTINGARVTSGAGSGGSIVLNITNLAHLDLSSGSSPNVNPGNGASGVAVGTAGTVVNVNSTNLASNISATGGDSVNNFTRVGGAGGGGRIYIQAGGSDQWCYLSGGTSIPAACEGRDVTIDGSVPYTDPTPPINNPNSLDPNSSDDYFSIDAGAQKIWQADTTIQECVNDSTTVGIVTNKCGNQINWAWKSVIHNEGDSCVVSPYGYDYSDQPNCDSKRHFTSLTITNNAVLTHSSLDPNKMPTSGNPSIAGLATGTERWKKVDLVISGDLTLSMGGEINVGGKGYPGGYYTNICGNNCVSTDPPHGFLSNNPSWFDGNGSQQTFGWGPGGGVTSPTSDWQGGGGGGFAGAGRQGFQWTGSIYYFKTGPGSMKTGVQSDGFNYGSGDYTYQPTAGSYEWGSGGGAAGTHGGSGSQNDVTVLFGGAGGGKVIIDARNIVFADYYQNSVLQDKNMNYTPGDTYTGIYADGQSGMIAQNENNAVWGGGGSGGLIYISGNINYNGSTLQASVSPGYMTDLGHAQFGKIQDSTGTDMSAKAFNLFARGGDARNANYNQTHGSGGGGGWIVFGNNNNRMTVNKTLYPVHRDGLPKDCVLNSSDGTPKTTDSSYPGCLFNPYAVQNNDVIEVRLEMQGNTVGVPYTIRDEWLQFPNPNDGYCTPLTNGQISAPGSTLYSATPGHDHPDGALDTSPYDFTIKDNINVLFYQCRVGTN